MCAKKKRGNSSPPLQLFFLISEQGLTIYDFRSIFDFMISVFPYSIPS